MNKLINLAILCLLSTASFAQFSQTVTVTDLQGDNVNVQACGSYCNPISFNTGNANTYPSITGGYTSLIITWTPNSSASFTFNVPFSDFSDPSQPTKTYTQPYAQVTVTKTGKFSYSFQLIGTWH